MSKTTTRAATKAQVLTAITVAAAGIAAYAVANLSEPTTNDGQSFSQQAIRRSCVYSCEQNHGSPCFAYLPGSDEQSACQVQVNACINTCPAPGPGIAMLNGSGVETLPTATRGTDYRQRLVLAAYEQEEGVWSVVENALPPGLNFDAQGTLYGIPTVPDRYRFTVEFTTARIPDVRDSLRARATVELVVEAGRAGVRVPGLSGDLTALGGTGGLFVGSPQTSATPVRITTPVRNLVIAKDYPYELRVAAEGITSADEPAWFLSYGELPHGLTLSAAGVISGTPDREETSAFGLAVRTNQSGPNAATFQDGSIQVTAGSISEATAEFSPADSVLPAGRVGTFASFPFSLSDLSNRVWTVEGINETEDGMRFGEASRILQGTPTRARTYTIVVRARREGGNTLSKTYTWTVQPNLPLLDITLGLPDGRAGQEYRTMLQGTGGSGSYAWRFEQPATAPTGWTLTRAGELKADAPREGVYTFFVHLDDTTTNLSKTAQMVVNVRSTTNVNETANPNQFDIVKTVPQGEAGRDYRTTLQATGGSGSYTWGFANAATAPAGWGLSSAGELTFPSAREGSYTFVVQVRDTIVNRVQQGEIVVRINPSGTAATTQTASTTALAFRDVGSYPDGFLTYYYNARPFDVLGGRQPYRFSVASGLPNGLSLDASSGSISGTPTRTGTFSFTMVLTDDRGDTVRANRAISIREAGERTITNTVLIPSTSVDSNQQARLNALAQMGIRIHDIVKLQDDGDVNTQYDSTVYYIGTDGRRHAFPNPQVYFTWFPNFSSVRIVGPRDLSDIPLGANITYRPGVRLVKFLSDPKVYLVDRSRTLRWVRTEADARTIYGDGWMRNVDDISDAFYMDYRTDGTVTDAYLIRPSELAGAANWPSEVLP